MALALYCLLALLIAWPPPAYSGQPSGGPSTGARYPMHTGGPYVTRYPAPVMDTPPTLEQLNKRRYHDLDPQLGIHLDGFTLWTLDDFGNHYPADQEYVRLTGRDMVNGDYHLVVSIKGAPALTDLFFYIRYHSDRYNPRLCTPGTAFGLDGDRLWISELAIPGLVAAGMTRIRPDRNGGIELEDGVVCEVSFEKRPAHLKPWWVERAPNHEHNQVRNLQAYEDPEDCSVVLYWEEQNLGDCNNDGEVNITDLIPIGRRYGRVSTDGHEDEWDQLLDTNDDGEVNYRDVWAIDHNIGSLLQGYRIYRRPADAPRQKEELLGHRTYQLLPMSIHRPLEWSPVNVNEYRYFDRELERTSRPKEWTYRIVPYNAANDIEGEGSDLEITVRVTTDSILVIKVG